MRWLLGLLFASLLGACTISNCARRQGLPLLVIHHLSSGPAPMVTGLTAYENQLLELATDRGKRHCRMAPEKEFKDLERYISSAEFLSTLRDIDSQHFEKLYFDYEELEIDYADLEVTIPVEKVPTAVDPLLRSVDILFHRTFGQRYKRPWPPRGQ